MFHKKNIYNYCSIKISNIYCFTSIFSFFFIDILLKRKHFFYIFYRKTERSRSLLIWFIFWKYLFIFDWLHLFLQHFTIRINISTLKLFLVFLPFNRIIFIIFLLFIYFLWRFRWRRYNISWMFSLFISIRKINIWLFNFREIN